MHQSSYTHQQVNLVLSGYGEIRVTPDGRYSVFDVIKVIGGKKNPHDAWKALTEQFPELGCEVDYLKFPGRGQRFTPVAQESLCLKILDCLGTNLEWRTSDKFYPRTEIQISQVLCAAFADYDPCPQFYVKGYRVDLYLAKPRLAIECDERNHPKYCQKLEKKREQRIKEALGCSFLRFNPYCRSFNIGGLIYRIRQLAN